MKNYKTLFFIISIFIVSHSAHSQSGWFWLNPLPQGNSLNSIKFVNSQKGFAVGNVGTIMRTNNAGENWSVFNTGFTNDLYSLDFTDESTLYSCGSGGIILKTTNSGISWNRISSGTTDNLFFIFFSDINIGYICGQEGRILKTTDEGKSWINQNTGLLNTLKGIYFFDTEKGFVCGLGIIMKTTNGGNNWMVNNYSSNFNAITFINDQTGFVAGGLNFRELRKTTNGGTSWLFSSLPGSSNELSSIRFINAFTGFICGKNSTFFKTTNSGLNWVYNNTITDETYNLSSVYFSGSSVGYLAGTYGTIFKSTDTGNNWSFKEPQGELGAFGQISFPGQNTGYITGNSGSTIFKTTNEGLNWQNLFTPFSGIYNMYFINDNTGFVNPWPEIYKTVNGGISWSEISVPNDTANLGAQFINENTGFVITVPYKNTQQYYKTTNGGSSWIPHFFSPGYLGNIYFLNNLTGYLASLLIPDSTYGLFKSTDLGENWNYINNIDVGSGNALFYTMNYVNENLIFIFSKTPSNKYILHKTTDGGNNWIQTGEFSNYKIIKFKNPNTGYLIDYTNYIWKTTNQGKVWDSTKLSDGNIFDIEFTNDNTGYLTGSGGMIKKTTNGGVVAVQNISTSIPDEFILEQNYPNPFNPVTHLEFGISNWGFVTLKIYNILGKEIVTLINENKSAGTYSVEWNAADFPSGIYFYELKVNKFSQTRKMILLK